MGRLLPLARLRNLLSYKLQIVGWRFRLFVIVGTNRMLAEGAAE